MNDPSLCEPRPLPSTGSLTAEELERGFVGGCSTVKVIVPQLPGYELEPGHDEVLALIISGCAPPSLQVWRACFSPAGIVRSRAFSRLPQPLGLRQRNYRGGHWRAGHRLPARAHPRKVPVQVKVRAPTRDLVVHAELVPLLTSARREQTACAPCTAEAGHDEEEGDDPEHNQCGW